LTSRSNRQVVKTLLAGQESSGETSVQITVNDEVRDVAAGTTIADLLEELGMRPKFVAVERNLELVPRARHAECELAENDKLEVVTLVGGG
jgi:sulfur carrier protein